MTIQPGRAGTSVEGGGELVGLMRSWRECDRGAFQGRTLHFTDPVGTAIELTCEMLVVDRRMQDYHHRGGCPQRPFSDCDDVQRAVEFYAALGFRLTEYTASDDNDELWGAWLQRKGNTHDIVFTNGLGPRLHHFA